MSTIPETNQNRIELPLLGMHCVICAGRIEKALRNVLGVKEVHVNYATAIAAVVFQTGETSSTQLVEAVRKEGFDAIISDGQSGPGVPGKQEKDEPETKSQWRQEKRLQRQFYRALGLSIPVVVLAMGGYLIPALAPALNSHLSVSIQMVLTTAVLFVAGRELLASAWRSALRLRADMDTLVVIGTLSAYGYSVLAHLSPGWFQHPGGRVQRHPQVYFEAAAVILTLILAGRILEARARRKASGAIQSLAGLQPRTARVERAGVEKDVPIEKIAVGDVIWVRPGEKVAVDGEVEEGLSTIDESMLTGESVPASKTTGDVVIGGTLNLTGVLRYRVTKVGQDTALYQIVRAVRKAQSSKPRIQRLADQMASWFVPAVLLVAALTFCGWFFFSNHPDRVTVAISTAVSVLIIACPCALGLATPTAITVATGRGAGLGILYRNAQALETAHKLTNVVFDKTGTLTAGHPQLSHILTYDVPEDEVLQLAASAEFGSEHRLGAAILQAAKERSLKLGKPKDFHSVSGYGVMATVKGHQICVGNARFMNECGITADKIAAHDFAAQGLTPVFVARDKEPIGILGLSDPIKPGAAGTVSRLKAMKLQVTMLTGDNYTAARSVANTLSIASVVAEVLPDAKCAMINGWKSGGGVVGMVGDGINDAPALAAADVGIAMGHGTDIAMDAADIVLVGGDLHGVVNAIELSRATVRNIRQNLFFAFIYNALGIPLAAGLFYPFTGWLLNPMIASVAMTLSSLSVLLNALRLRSFKPGRVDAPPASGSGGITLRSRLASFL